MFVSVAGKKTNLSTRSVYWLFSCRISFGSVNGNQPAGRLGCGYRCTSDLCVYCKQLSASKVSELAKHEGCWDNKHIPGLAEM